MCVCVRARVCVTHTPAHDLHPAVLATLHGAAMRYASGYESDLHVQGWAVVCCT
jgi:hypothetical protein